MAQELRKGFHSSDRDFQQALQRLEDIRQAVSYTHLTLPTKA